MTYDRELRTEAAHALTHNQEVWSDRGYAVVTAGGLSEGDTDFEVDVGPYDVLVGDTDETSVGPTTLSVNAPDNDPYWLVVYVDSEGLQTEQGPEGEVFVGDQSVVATNADVREITSPAPPTLANIGPVTVLGKVLVTSSGVSDSLIDDRVFQSERVFDVVNANDISAGRLDIGNVRYRDEVGESIDIDPDSGQVSVFVDGISSSALVYVDFFVAINDSSADAFLRFNDDSDTNYDYDLSDGTTPTGQSEIVLGDFSDSFSQVGGELLIQQREIGARPCGPVNAGGRIGRTNAVCERFTYEGAENVNKIELFAGEDGDQISDIGLKVTEVII